MLSSAKSGAQSVANDTKDAARHVGATARDAVETVSNDARSVAHRAGQEARRVFSTAKDEFGNAADTVGDQIRNRPVQSTLVALGFGLLLGAFLNRK